VAKANLKRNEVCLESTLESVKCVTIVKVKRYRVPFIGQQLLNA